MKLLLSLLLLLSCFSSIAQDKLTKLHQELIVKNPPFAECHSSTILETTNGTLLVSFFAGSREGQKDVSIWLTRSASDGWAKPYIVADGIINDSLRYPCWNPVLFQAQNGKLFLFYKVGKNPREWWGMMRISDDEGQTWTDPQKLPEGVLGPIKNKPVQLSDSTILSASSVETDSTWKVHMEKSDDLGKSWKIIPVNHDSPFKVIQPTILQHGNDTLQILCRSDQDRIVESWSYDNGDTWSKYSKLDLANPNSGIDGVTLNNRNHLLVYNPQPKGREWFNNREKLNVAASPDGVTWHDVAVLENGNKQEFSYPAVIQGCNGDIHITYTYDRKNIKYVRMRVPTANRATSP